KETFNSARSIGDSLLPTGSAVGTFVISDRREVEATCIGSGQPMAILSAPDLGIIGHPSIDDLKQHDKFRQSIEELRVQSGKIMRLGPVGDKPYSKMTVMSLATASASMKTRSFIP